MTKHLKIYLEYFGFDVSDYIQCEVCFSPADDIHHIEKKDIGAINYQLEELLSSSNSTPSSAK